MSEKLPQTCEDCCTGNGCDCESGAVAESRSRAADHGDAGVTSGQPRNAASTSRRPRKWWLCPCGTRNPRTRQKCDCGRRRPKKRVPVHARTLRDDPYETYREVNERLHGHAFDGEWTPDCCGVCGKPPSSTRHMDRDHDHVTGKPRGLACPGNTGCNALMPRQLTLERARMIVRYLEEAQDG